MNNLPDVLISVGSQASMSEELKKPSKANSCVNKRAQQQKIGKTRTCQAGKLHSRFAGHMAFGAAVFVSVMAAAAVVSHDLPLMLGGF